MGSLEDYIKLRGIGKGSYGEVFLMKHKKDKKQYVLKKLNISTVSKRESKAAEQEAKLLSKLRHPNIVAYRDSFENDGNLFIAMAFCDGGDLYSILKSQKGTSLSEQQIGEWFVQISMALQYMHERNILHRDLKTQNIFLTKNKLIKVGDLGIARVLDSSSDMATTLIGTPYYMSPELFSNKPYNYKSDVWALGCVVYEMATLKHAFNAKDMNSLVYKILRGKMPSMPTEYSRELVTLIKAMLNHNPDKRPSVNRILRDPYIRENIARYLDGTKKEKKRPKSSKGSSGSSERPTSRRTGSDGKAEDRSKNAHGSKDGDHVDSKPKKPKEKLEPLNVGPDLEPISEEMEGAGDSQRSNKGRSNKGRLQAGDEASKRRPYQGHSQNDAVVISVENTRSGEFGARSSGDGYNDDARKGNSGKSVLVGARRGQEGHSSGGGGLHELKPSADQRRASPTRNHSGPGRRRGSRGSEETSATSSSSEKERSGERRPSSGERRSNSGERRPSSGEKRVTTGEKRPTTGERRPTTGERRSSGGDIRPGSAGESRKKAVGSSRPSGRARPLPPRPSNSGSEPVVAGPGRGPQAQSTESGYGSSASRDTVDTARSSAETPRGPNLSARARRRERKESETPRTSRSVDIERRRWELGDIESEPTRRGERASKSVDCTPRDVVDGPSKGLPNARAQPKMQPAKSNPSLGPKHRQPSFTDDNSSSETEEEPVTERRREKENKRPSHNPPPIKPSLPLPRPGSKPYPPSPANSPKLAPARVKGNHHIMQHEPKLRRQQTESGGEEEDEEGVDEQVESRKNNKEMNKFISLLDTTLRMNREEDKSDEDDELKPEEDSPPEGVGHGGAGFRRNGAAKEEENVVIEVEEDTLSPRADAHHQYNVNVSRPGRAAVTMTTTGRLWERITILRKDCMRGLGISKLKQAYDILDNFEVDELEPRLIALLGQEDFETFAGKIWNLKFCEEAAFGLI